MTVCVRVHHNVLASKYTSSVLFGSTPFFYKKSTHLIITMFFSFASDLSNCLRLKLLMHVFVLQNTMTNERK